jgi:hypothetical protein
MNTQKLIERSLASLTLATLAVYVLACGTAFSPDDSKIIYPAFDPKTGDVGAWMYDRQTLKSEPLFIPSRLRDPGGKERQGMPLRPIWLPDGKDVAILWPGYSDNDDDVLNIVVLPAGGKGRVRMLNIPGVTDAINRLMFPPAAVNGGLFFGAESNLVVRVDLESGQTSARHIDGVADEFNILGPASPGTGLFYYTENKEEGFVAGTLDPDTMKVQPRWRIKDAVYDEVLALAVSPDGKQFVMVAEGGGKRGLHVAQVGQATRTLPLDLPEKSVAVGMGTLAPKQEVFYATYAEQPVEGKPANVGLLEISLKDGALRRTPLFSNIKLNQKDGMAAFQVDVSHDGTTAAICTTMLSVVKDTMVQPDASALYLVDLSSAERKVTKVAIPIPEVLSKR